MSKNILIIYPYDNHRRLMSVFSQKLYENGVFVDVICIQDFHVIQNTQIQWGWFILFVIEQCRKKTIIGKVFRRFFKYITIYTIIKKYDLIDFHAFVEYDSALARYCQKKGISYDITLWGSDLMRASDSRIKQMKMGFDGSRYIKSSENLHDVLVSKYGNCYDFKYWEVYFGNNDYEEIDSLSKEDEMSIKQKLYGDINGKKIVICGYNGVKAQNHELIIQSFQHLRSKYSSKVHLVFPMTYRTIPQYMKDIRELLMQTGYTFTILEDFLSSKEVAVIRRTADFVINIQTTDAFSSSLQDHLYCNEVLLIGEWLRYTLLEKHEVYYLKTSSTDLTSNIDDALSNLESYREKCRGNHEKMKAMTSWEFVIDNWVSAYGIYGK